MVNSCLLVVNYEDLEGIIGLGVSGKDSCEALLDHIDSSVSVALGVPFCGDNVPANVLCKSSHKFVVLEVCTIEVDVPEVPLAIAHASNHSGEVERVYLASSLVTELSYFLAKKSILQTYLP